MRICEGVRDRTQSSSCSVDVQLLKLLCVRVCIRVRVCVREGVRDRTQRSSCIADVQLLKLLCVRAYICVRVRVREGVRDRTQRSSCIADVQLLKLLCVCACLYLCAVSVCTYVYTHTHILGAILENSADVHVYMCVHMYAHIYLYVSVRTYAQIYTSTYIPNCRMEQGASECVCTYVYE